MVVSYVDEKKKNATLYDRSKLKEKDKHALFLGGNYSMIDIRTTAAVSYTHLMPDQIKKAFLWSLLILSWSCLLYTSGARYEGSSCWMMPMPNLTKPRMNLRKEKKNLTRN